MQEGGKRITTATEGTNRQGLSPRNQIEAKVPLVGFALQNKSAWLIITTSATQTGAREMSQFKKCWVELPKSSGLYAVKVSKNRKVETRMVEGVFSDSGCFVWKVEASEIPMEWCEVLTP